MALFCDMTVGRQTDRERRRDSRSPENALKPRSLHT